MPFKPFFIYLSGLMGSGKSSIAPLIAGYLPKCQLFLEDINENLYLNDFYDDMKKWSFHSRISFLGLKAKIYPQISSETQYVIIDRGIFELLPYAKLQFDLGNMDNRDMQTYMHIYDMLTFFIPVPNFIIYLHCSIDETLARVRVRNRSSEQNMRKIYLEQGRNVYNQWFDCATADHKFNIDTTNLSLKSYEHLAFDIAKDAINLAR